VLNKDSSLLLIVFGVLLIIVACVVVIANLGITIDQIKADESIIQIFSDYFFRYGIAFILTIIGAVAVGLGLRK